MAKYHINSRGLVAICRAKNHCPLGSAFDSKSSATTAAEKESTQFRKVDIEREANARKRFNEALANGDISKIESGMHSHSAESLEDVAKEIADVKSKGDIKKTLNNLTLESNEVFKQKQEIVAKKKNELLNSEESSDLKAKQAEVEKAKKLVEDADALVKEKNEGTCPKCGEGKLSKKSGAYGDFIACSNYPKCKHTQKPVSANPNLKKKLESAEHSVKVAEQALDKKANSVAEQEEEYKVLQAQSDAIKNRMKVAQYIDSHENPRGNNGYKSSKIPGPTPIEQYYEERKEADEKIFKKLGHARVSMDSSNFKFGQNEITEKLTVDSKGNINNLYIENPNKKGEAMRVVKIHEDAFNNIELEDGTKLSLNAHSNFKVDRGNVSPPPNWRFYTRNSKSKNEYKGYNKILVNKIDSGD